MNTPSVSVDVDEFSGDLGSTIRRRRKALALSLVEVSARTGLSHSFLSQLERGKTHASMRSLFAIAQALETTQEELIAASTTGGPAGPAASGAARVQLLMHAGDQLDISEFKNLPREQGEFFEHDRPEFVYVVSGEIEFEMRPQGSANTTALLLTSGQSVSCPGAMAHRYRSVGETLATVLMIHYPN